MVNEEKKEFLKREEIRTMRKDIELAHEEEAKRGRERISGLKIKEEVSSELTSRQSDLLTGVVNAIRGDPEPLHLHSHHDAPELAKSLKADNDRLREQNNNLIKGSNSYHGLKYKIGGKTYMDCVNWIAKAQAALEAK